MGSAGLAALALALLVVAGGVGWTIAMFTDSSDEVTAGSDESDDAAQDDAIVDEAALEAEASTESESDVQGDEPASPTTAPASSADSEPFVVPDTPDNPSGAAQYSVMADNKAIMRGWYPTAELAQRAVDDAAVIMGGIENVVDETQIDPRAEIRPDTYAVYFEDYILFETDSAEVAPDFYEFLGYPLFFMMNNAEATVTVVARTDATGPADYNMTLATRRAEAVRDFWLENGANPDQIFLDPRGEEEAEEGADPEQAQLDRRAELIVSGFLSG
jgi:outer membrane protein OmpA-like peptidoglycan-associated protein